MEKRIAIVTGANRGIGFEVCRQLAQLGYQTILAARDAAKAQEAAAALQAAGLPVQAATVDVAHDASVQALAAQLEAQYGRVDVLVNNAGSHFDYMLNTEAADMAFVHEAFETNLFGAWRMMHTLLPLLRKSADARVVNVSSEAGSFGAGYGMLARGNTLSAYSVSKAALNALTVKWALALQEDGILVNAVCPGFTATYPGTAEMGARPVAEGAASVVWAAQLPKDGPTGGFFRDGQPLAW